jgi:hypothetical protein
MRHTVNANHECYIMITNKNVLDSCLVLTQTLIVSNIYTASIIHSASLAEQNRSYILSRYIYVKVCEIYMQKCDNILLLNTNVRLIYISTGEE